MDIGTVLVGLGIIFAVLAFFVPEPAPAVRGGRWYGGLLNLAVILIGIGVLVGVSGLHN